MYLRETQRRNADGSVARYFQLAENVWDAHKGYAVAKVVYNFGRAEQLDREGLKRLARSILRVFTDEEALAAQPDVKIVGAWPYGVAHVVEALWRELGIDEVLADKMRGHRRKQPFARALLAMVTNRVQRPSSKRWCREHWLGEDVFFPGESEIELHHLYRAMDFLEAHKADIEKAIYFRMADLMNADVDVIFYDTTTLHTEIDADDEQPSTGNALAGRRMYEPLRKYGRSKDGRDDVPQVLVGLAVTRDGLPVRSWVFPGNTSDVTTVEKVKEDLRGWRLGRCVFVGDAGMNSDENRRTLALGGGKYILATKMRAGDEVTTDVMTRAGRYQKVAENLDVKEVFVGDGERRRRYVVCHNAIEAERQANHRKKVLEHLAAELVTLEKPKRGARHSKRTCGLLTTQRYARYLRQTPRGALKISLAAVRAEEKLDGKWVVTTNDDTLSPADLALGYKQLMRAEECFRTMKQGLRTRPFFHWTPHRICAHVSLCVLALLVERVAEIRTQQTWRNIAAQLDTIKVVEYERGEARVRQTSEVRGDLADLVKRLGVPLPPRFHSVGPTPST
jgi:transposase